MGGAAARAAAAACLLLLLASGAGASACTEQPDPSWIGSFVCCSFPDMSNGCKRCSADGARCLECWPYWGLDSDGTCKLCPDHCLECDGATLECKACKSDPGGGEPRTLVDGACVLCKDRACVECRDPAVCTKCREDRPTVINGTCDVPPPCDMEGCSRCDASGACSACYGRYGLVDGVCQPCADERCMRCDGNAAVCSECNDEDSEIRGPVLYVDAATGACKWCGGGDECVRCASTSSCVECRWGWFLDPAQQCQPCPDGCLECTSATNCTSCTYGMGVVGGACRNCTQPHCLSCDGDTGRCLSCGTEEGARSLQEPGTAYFADPASGACVPCPEQEAGLRCTACRSASRCDECAAVGQQTFLDATVGMRVDEQTGKCVKCPTGCLNCLRSGATCQECFFERFALVNGTTCAPCSDARCVRCEDGPDRCAECGGDYGADASGRCVPCSTVTPRCTSCVLPKDTTTTLCTGCDGDGWWADGRTNSCKPCTVPNCLACDAYYNPDDAGFTHPNWCISCAAGYEVNPNDGSCVKCGEGSVLDPDSGGCIAAEPVFVVR